MNNDGRIASLDGLRALSIILVVVSHLAVHFDFNIDNLGNYGVKVFFVISGFLITTILVAEFEKTKSISLKKFYFRRTLRIFPAYYFYIFCIFLAAIFGVYQIPLVNFFSPLTYTSNYMTTDVWELGHSWSLSVEEQFYLIYPGLFILLGMEKIKKVLAFLVITVPIIRLCNLLYLFFSDGTTDKWFFFGFHTNMDALAIGCLLTFYRKDFHTNLNYQKFLNSSFAFAVLPLIIFVVLCNSQSAIFYLTFGWTILTCTTAFGIDWLISNEQSVIGKIFNLAPVKYIGVLSYSIYLWQQPFSKYSENLIWTHYPFNLISIILLSLISYHLVEKSFLILRKKLEKNLITENNVNRALSTKTNAL